MVACTADDPDPRDVDVDREAEQPALLAAPPADHADEDPDQAASEGCRDVGEAGRVVLRWLDHEKGEPEATDLSGTVTRIAIHNVSELAAELDVQLVADDGGHGKVVKALGSFGLGSDEKQELDVDLAALGLSLEDQRYSGRLTVVAQVLVDGALVEQEVSAPLYFHRAPWGAIRVYDEALLVAEFNAGNFRATELPSEVEALPLDDQEEQATIDRITWGGGDAQGDLGQLGPSEIDGQSDPTLVASPMLPRATYTGCFKFDILTTDSGYDRDFCSSDCKEDWWPNQNDPSASDVTAYGVRVKIGSTTYDTNPSTGCVTFTASGGTHDVTVYAYATDANDNFVRIHDGAPDLETSYPGATFSAFIDDQVFTADGTTTIAVGADTDRWTSMASLAFALYRYHDGISDSEIHVAETHFISDPMDPLYALSCKDGFYGPDPANNEAYLRLANDTCAVGGQFRKFVNAHEYGHALTFLHGNHTSVPFTASHNVTPSNCDMESEEPGRYGMEHKEWSSVGKEAYADFVSAKVWNNYDPDGTFRKGSGNYNLEKWDSSNTELGYLRNVCCPPSLGSGCAASLDGAGTRQDWLRALWDIYTYAGCSPTNTQAKMLDLFDEIADSGSYADDTWYTITLDGINALIGGSALGSCYDEAWEDYACHNGVAFTGTLPGGC
jgi:hypothetical protein